MTSWIKKSLQYRGLALALLLVADGVLIAVGLFAWLVMTLPRLPDDPETLIEQSGINIYAHSGELLYTFNQRVGHVRLDEVSPYFVQAVLATEDLDFYHHRGYSFKGIVGAVWYNLSSGRKTRGGSTLTQQIVKNVFLTREKSYIRKLKEALLAAQLEAVFERRYGEDYKDRLLEVYINGSFYGTNAYGVADAAHTYFEKSAGELTLLESALLAGLPNAPGALSPFRQDRETVMKRVGHVLRRMETVGFITEAQRDSALADSLRLASGRKPQNRTPYFVETIKAEIARLWGSSTLSFGGLNVYTTLDLRLQRGAEQAVSEGLVDLDRQLGFPDYDTADQSARANYVQGALISLEPRTGHVKAMVGGRDIFVSYYNRATQARRQPGSGFKPITYLAAFEADAVTPVSLFVDEPRTYTVNRKPWTPRNFKNSYLGLTTAAQALVKSANATAVQVMWRTGAEKIVDMARRLGVRSPLHPYPSIALGAEEVTLLDMATAYSTIAHYGFYVEPTFIRSIVDVAGDTLYVHVPNRTPVVDPTYATVLIRLLENVVDEGTGRRVRALGFVGAAAGKTGTTNDNTDAWFTGFTPNLVTSVWVGFDDRERGRLINKRTRGQITGGSGAAPIWTAFMKSASPPADAFVPPGGVHVETHRVDLRTGIAVADSVPDSLAPRAVEIALPLGVLPNSPADTLAFWEAFLDSGSTEGH